MTLTVFWLVLGALIGVAAAQRKGFSVVGGLIGGLLLGPLAVLMFFVSGVAVGRERRKCPHCAEWIRPEASVCPHCQRDIPDPANFPCPKCKKPFFVAAAAHGHAARCPHCKKMVQT